MNASPRTKKPGAPRVPNGLGLLCVVAALMAVITPRSSAEIILDSRFSQATASAHNYGTYDNPPPQTQSDFLPAALSNSAHVSGESGFADGTSRSNSSITVDNSMGTLRVTGDGYGSVSTGLPDAGATAEGKLVILSFT